MSFHENILKTVFTLSVIECETFDQVVIDGTPAYQIYHRGIPPAKRRKIMQQWIVQFLGDFWEVTGA